MWTVERSGARLELAGELGIRDGSAIWSRLHACARDPGPALDIDVSRAGEIDGAVMALVAELRGELIAQGTRCELVGADDRLAPIVHLYRADAAPPAVASVHPPRPLEQLGARLEAGWGRARDLVAFTGDVVEAVGAVALRPRLASWRSLPVLVERAGTDGLPIVILLNFLVGFVIAYQSTPELRMFGANVYIADVVGVSLTRELAPLMTAIIIAGRSGAGYAAELGTMRVSDEIDALRVMGCAPVPYLVLPRVLALALVAPLVTLVGDVVGVLGGLVVSVRSLDVSATGYVAKLGTAVVASDVWTGLVKSVAFAVAIAIVGCRQGLSARGAAAGVGRGTTATVVHCLFAIVLLDTLFTVVFRELGV